MRVHFRQNLFKDPYLVQQAPSNAMHYKGLESNDTLLSMPERRVFSFIAEALVTQVDLN